METLDLSIVLGFISIVAGIVFYYYHKSKKNETFK